MKRERELALDESIDEIIATAKEKKEVKENVALTMFFYARYELIELLKERPVALLNLLQTNKALASIWSEFDGIWPILIDYLYEREAGSYFSEIYPLLIVQNHRSGTPRIARIMQREASGNADTLEREALGIYYPFLESRLSVGRLEPGGFYYLIKYDDFTKHYIELLHKVDLFIEQHGELFPKVNLSMKSALERYTYFIKPFICLDEYFMIDDPDTFEAWRPIRYQLYDDLEKLVRIFNAIAVFTPHPTAIERPPIDSVAVVPYIQIQQLVASLWRQINKNDFQLPSQVLLGEPLLLTKTSVQPYREILFKGDNAIYNTPEKQKTLIRAILGELASLEGSDREYVIEKYGDVLPLSCRVCGTDTFHVDVHTSTVLCSDHCRRRRQQLSFI